MLTVHTKFDVPYFTNSQYMIRAQKLKKNSHLALTMLLLGVVCHPRITLVAAHRRTKFDDSSFSNSTDMIGDPSI